MKIKLGTLKRLIRETSMTRSERNPSNYDAVTKWGFTHVPWPEFVKRFPQAAESFASTTTEGWSDEDIAQAGGHDPLTWPTLYDDEMFLDREENPVALVNITGAGGSLWLGYQAGTWDEIMFDDDGNREDF
jgi:hypothetical protein